MQKRTAPRADGAGIETTDFTLVQIWRGVERVLELSLVTTIVFFSFILGLFGSVIELLHFQSSEKPRRNE